MCHERESTYRERERDVKRVSDRFFFRPCFRYYSDDAVAAIDAAVVIL